MTTDNVDEGDRNPADLVLFAVGFIGFMSFAGGIVVLSANLTLIGAILFLCSVGFFYSQTDW